MSTGSVIKYSVVLLIWLSCITLSGAQDITVRGGFFLDSLRVGDETGYYLSATYPSSLNIIFPDSTFFWGDNNSFFHSICLNIFPNKLKSIFNGYNNITHKVKFFSHFIVY